MREQLCVDCGDPIVGKRSDAKYCSDSCRSSAEKRRYKERRGQHVVKRGKNTGRSKTREYRVLHNKKAKEKKRQQVGYKGRYAKARELGYRSMFEVAVVKAAEEEGLPLEYEPFKIPYEMHLTYLPDAVLPNGILIEFKGRMDEKARRKMLAVKHCNPNLDIRIIFQRANTKITKARKSKMYWQWAEANGFQWSEGTIPLSWWREKPNGGD